MQPRSKKIALLLAFFVFYTFVDLSVAQDIKNAVGRVIAKNGSKNRNSTGFVWESSSGKRYIVTCLHGVVGAEKLYFDIIANELDIVKVDKESDLVLLVPKSEKFSLSKSPALKLTDSAPSSSKTYKIYGFPAGVKTIQGDELKLSDADQIIAMKDYLSNDNLNAVTSRGYPEKAFKVLRVSSGITPGHSGAPIIDPQNKNSVIGIGSGGLSFKGFERVNWAAPAEYYLPKLESAGKGPETVKSIQPPKEVDYQYSATSTNEGVAKNDNSTFYGTYTIPLSEIYENIDPQIKDFIKMLSDEYNYDFKDMMLDIYSDYNTGATIAVPAGIPLSTKDDMFIASANNDNIQMLVKVGESSSFDASFDKIKSFDNYILSQEEWESDLKRKEEKPYEEDGWWEQTRFMSVKEYDEEYKEDVEIHWLSADYSIEYEDDWADYLGVAVMGFDVDQMSDDDELLYQKMAICTQLTGFAIK